MIANSGLTRYLELLCVENLGSNLPDTDWKKQDLVQNLGTSLPWLD